MEDVLSHRPNQHSIADPIMAVVQTVLSSARNSLRILSSLKTQHLLETFLPFDLEQTFSSISVLTLISALSLAPEFDYEDCADIAISIFDAMISRGNRVAEFRRNDLKQLQEATRQIYTNTRTSRVDREARSEAAAPHTEHTGTVPSAVEALEPSSPGLRVTYASTEVLPIAAFLEWDLGFPNMLNDRLPDDWLWTDTETSAFGYGVSEPLANTQFPTTW